MFSRVQNEVGLWLASGAPTPRRRFLSARCCVGLDLNFACIVPNYQVDQILSFRDIGQPYLSTGASGIAIAVSEAGFLAAIGHTGRKNSPGMLPETNLMPFN